MSLNRSIQRLLGATSHDVPSIGSTNDADPKRVILNFLAVEGIQATSDRDGDITFDRDGLHFVLLFDPRDPEFVSLALPNIDKANGDQDRAVVVSIAQRITGQVKAAKLCVMPDGRVWATCEWIVASPVHLVPVLLRACQVLEASVKAYAVLRKF